MENNDYQVGEFETMDIEKTEETSTDDSNGDENPEKHQKKKFNKTFIYMAIILIATGLVLYFSLKDSFFNTVDVISHADFLFIFYGILCFFGAHFIEGFILYLFARRYKRHYYLHQGVANQMIGIFYNAVTPGQTGGQFMQAYTYKKQGLTLPNATSCLVMNFIVYQSTLVLYSLFALFYKFNELMAIEPISIEINGTVILSLPIWVLTMISFIINVGVIGLIFLMSYSKHFHNFVLNKGVGLFAKLHIVKDPEKARRKLSVSVESFKLELNNLFTKPLFLIVIFLLHVASLTLIFMVPYFVGIAVTQPGSGYASFDYSLIDTIAYSGYQKLVAELIPIPGSAGTAEYFFYKLFSGAFVVSSTSPYTSYELASSLNIIWRTITFHLPLLISGIVAAFYKGSNRGDPIYVNNEQNTSFIELQSETIIQRQSDFETEFNTRMEERPRKRGRKRKNDNKE